MRLRQIVFAAQDLAAARSLLADVLDLPAPFSDPGVAEFGLHNAVFALGDQFVEVVSPTQPNTACSRHLARHGDSGYMLLLQTDSLARERSRFEALGVRSVWQTEHEDIVAMHLHPKDLGAAIVSVDEPRPAASWRWGGPAWQFKAGARPPLQPGRAGAQRVRGVTLQAQDPQALAQRWAQVLGLPAPEPADGGWRLALQDASVLVQPAPVGGLDAVVGFSLAVDQPDAVLARARAAGLPVEGSTVTLLGVHLALQPV